MNPALTGGWCPNWSPAGDSIMEKCKGQAVDGQMEDAPLAITVAISDKFIYELLREENSLSWGEWKSSLKEWSSEPTPAPGAENSSGESSRLETADLGVRPSCISGLTLAEQRA